MLTAHPRTQPEAALDTDEWNDSLAGEFLWSNVNVSEAVPDVMTPSTWSLWRIFHYETNPIRFPGDYPFCGNICGRPYFNLSLLASVYRAVGRDARQELQADLIGSAPPDLDMPLLSFSPWRVYRTVFPGTLKARWLMRRCRQDMARFLAAMPDECRLTGTMIREARDPAALLLIWSRTLKPLIVRACEMLRTVTAELGGPATRLRQAFSRLVGETEANLLLSNLSGAAGGLASLGPITGLAQVVRGQMSRATYLERYGHRGPHEMELSAPGADDDPAWLDKQLAVFAQSVAAADALLEKQRAEQSAAWARLAARYPAKSPALRRELDRVAAAARNREAVRSEVTRAARLLRVFLLKAGDIAGLAEGVFFLTLAETTRTLAGDPSAGAHIPARRELYRKYCALPPYPAIIIGRFDPFVWAADPDRRSDLFDGRVSRPVAAAAVITGFPGAAGCVEGVVRRLACPDEGRWLQPGEILVAVTTNVGWTPLFPRAAAIVTDIGAPLSHAAIVARELGIPAVVGCGNATARLKTGDRVRVDGARGTVEVLERPTHQGYCVP